MSRLQSGLSRLTGQSASLRGSQGGADRQGSKSFEELKRLIHSKLVDKLDLSRVSDLEGDTLRREIRLVPGVCQLVEDRDPGPIAPAEHVADVARPDEPGTAGDEEALRIGPRRRIDRLGHASGRSTGGARRPDS